MSSVQSKIVKGKQPRPYIHVLYGINGVGKSTWASKFPEPLFLDLEKGSAHLDVDRIFDIPDFEAFKTQLEWVATGNHEYKTLVVDSIEALESMIFEFVCKEGSVNSIELYGGGFGKGFMRSRELMREVMGTYRALTEKRGITVIQIGHAQQKTYTDAADNAQYDRYTMRVNDKMGSIIRDLSDNVFFACHKVYTTKVQGKTQAISDNERVMRTEWRAGFDAKNRMSLPFEIELSYKAFKEASENPVTKSIEELRAELNTLVLGVDAGVRDKASKQIENATTVQQLIAIKGRLEEVMKSAA